MFLWRFYINNILLECVNRYFDYYLNFNRYLFFISDLIKYNNRYTGIIDDLADSDLSIIKEEYVSRSDDRAYDKNGK